MTALKKIFSILFCIVILSQAQAVESNAKLDVQVKGEEDRCETVGGFQCRFAIYLVLGHENAMPFGRDKEAERRRIIFSDNRSGFNAMRPENYPLGGLILGEKPLLTEADVVSYNWTEHVIQLKPGVRGRFPKPSVGGVPFVVVVGGKRLYLGAFWTGLSSSLANMPTISLDTWFNKLPESEPHYLPKDAIRIENSQVLREGEKPRDPRNDWRVHRTLVELGKLVDLRSADESTQGKAVGGLRCRIEASRKRFLVDNPISFRITFENVGKKAIHLRGVGESIYEAGDFYFNDQKVKSMPFIHARSRIRPLVPLNPDQSKVVLFTLNQWGLKGHNIPQAPGQYNVRFHYMGGILDSDRNDDGFISQSLGEVVSNTVKIEIAEQPILTDPKAEIEALGEVLEKLREEFGYNCFIFDTMIRGPFAGDSQKYQFILMHNPRTSKLGKKEAAEIVKWSFGEHVAAENDKYFLLVSQQPEDVEKQDEMIAKICALLNLEKNNIRRDMANYLTEETRFGAREMGGEMVLTLHPGLLLKEIVSWAGEPSMEDVAKFMQKYPEERNWHAQNYRKVATFLQKKGQWGEAIEIYQKMIDDYGEVVLPMFPGNISAKDQAQLGMADCYRQMGNNTEALEILDNLKSQTRSRMISRQAEKEYVELYDKTFNQSK